jgi:hypothetical protein
MRWHYRDPLLLWSFPCAYGLHIVEELAGDFPGWVELISGGALPVTTFVAINAVAMIVMVAAVHAASRHERLGWMAVAIAAVLVLNAVLHLAGSLYTGVYSPGLFTGVVLYLPLGQLLLFRAWQQALPGAFSRGVFAGVIVHLVVIAIAALASR